MLHTHAGPAAMVIWLTGLSSAGKTTIAEFLYLELRSLGRNVEWLDGDIVRKQLCPDLGFSKADRDENIRRVTYMAELLTRNGVIVLVSAISPYREAREMARSRILNFVEVYVNAPLAVCEARDVKGLYLSARAGTIKHLSGLDDPYEPPYNPEVECRTDLETPAESAAKVLRVIWSRLTAEI